jgi:hypothetical protein
MAQAAQIVGALLILAAYVLAQFLPAPRGRLDARDRAVALRALQEPLPLAEPRQRGARLATSEQRLAVRSLTLQRRPRTLEVRQRALGAEAPKG